MSTKMRTPEELARLVKESDKVRKSFKFESETRKKKRRKKRLFF